MTLLEIGGLVGVGLILVGYAGAQIDRLDPKKPPALIMNLVGALLILGSLTEKFNLASFVVESAWALVAIFGLVQVVRKRN